MDITAELPFLTDPKQIKAWLDSVGVKGWNINEAGLVDVETDVFLGEKLGSLTKLAVRFGKVTGDFFCEYNQLVSLEGAPKEVGWDFHCGNNQIVSLVGAPEKVGGYFRCDNNQLASLEGASKQIGGDFWCYRNLLVDFKGLEDVGIAGALVVTSPETAGQDNVFISLEGLPMELYGRVQGLDIKALLALETQHSNILDIEIYAFWFA